MADLEATPSAMDAGPPFADWREQLRERVKEIRARRQGGAIGAEAHAEAAADGDVSDLGSKATADKLAQARAQAARAMAADVEAGTDPAAIPQGLISDDRDERRAEIAHVVDSLLHDEMATTSDDAVHADAPPPPQIPASPQAHTELEEAHAEPTQTATGPAHEPLSAAPSASMKALLEETVSEAQQAARVRPSANQRVLDPEAEPRIPTWAQPERSEDSIRPALPPDRKTVPPEMRDIDIPAWALPHQRDSVSTPDATDTASADVHLVGEFAAGAGRSAAHAPTVAEETAATARSTSLGDAPGRLPLTQPAEATGTPAATPSGRPQQPVDPLAPSATGDARRFPGLFDAGSASATPNAGDARIHEPAAPRDREIGELQPADESLAWDLDAPVDPDVLLDAQRQAIDPCAPVSDRVFSAVADGLVLLTVGLLLVIGGASAAGTPLLPFVVAAPIPLAAAWVLFGFVYGTMFVGTCGQTLGKMAMRVRVIGADSFRVGYARAARRTLLYTLASLPAFLGLLPALRDPEHRAMHDRLTGTRVVKA